MRATLMRALSQRLAWLAGSPWTYLVARSSLLRELDTSVATTLIMSSLSASSKDDATEVLKAAFWAVPKPEADTPVSLSSEAICTSSDVAKVGRGVGEEVGTDVGCGVGRDVGWGVGRDVGCGVGRDVG